MKKINNSSTSKALFKNTGIIAIGQISTKIVNFLLLPLYTALLTTEEYGLVDLLTTYACTKSYIKDRIKQRTFVFKTYPVLSVDLHQTNINLFMTIDSYSIS